MENKYIPNVDVGDLDDDITNIIERIDNKELGGKPMIIAVKNEKGEIYREIIVHGLSSFLDLINSISELGFTDVYKDDYSQHKHDCLFERN